MQIPANTSTCVACAFRAAAALLSGTPRQNEHQHQEFDVGTFCSADFICHYTVPEEPYKKAPSPYSTDLRALERLNPFLGRQS